MVVVRRESCPARFDPFQFGSAPPVDAAAKKRPADWARDAAKKRPPLGCITNQHGAPRARSKAAKASDKAAKPAAAPRARASSGGRPAGGKASGKAETRRDSPGRAKKERKKERLRAASDLIRARLETTMLRRRLARAVPQPHGDIRAERLSLCAVHWAVGRR